MIKKSFYYSLFVIIGIIIIFPFIIMFKKSFYINGQIDLSLYEKFFTSKANFTLFKNSFLLAGTVALLATISGLPLAVLLNRTNIYFKKVLLVLFTFPLFVPPYIFAISWYYILGKNGILNSFLHTGAITSSLFFGFPGCVFIHFSIFLPVVIIVVSFFLKGVNPNLENSARLYTGWKRVMLNITVPTIFKGIVLAFVLVFILSFGELSVPTFLRYDVFPVVTFLKFSAFYDYSGATVSTIPVLILGLIFVFTLKSLKTANEIDGPSSEEQLLIELGKNRLWVSFLMAVSGIILIVIPFSVLVMKSGGIKNIVHAFKLAQSTLLRSLYLAAIGGLLITIMGFFIAYFEKRENKKGAFLLDSLSLVAFAIPGTVIGVGLILLWNTPQTNFIYSSPIIIVLGYLAKYTAISSKIFEVGFGKYPPSAEEAAMMCGASWIKRLFFITIPMLKHLFLLSFVVGFIFSLNDVGITMLVYPPNFETVSVKIFTLMANGREEIISSLCLILVLTVVFAMSLFFVLKRFKHEHSGN